MIFIVHIDSVLEIVKRAKKVIGDNYAICFMLSVLNLSHDGVTVVCGGVASVFVRVTPS